VDGDTFASVGCEGEGGAAGPDPWRDPGAWLMPSGSCRSQIMCRSGRRRTSPSRKNSPASLLRLIDEAKTVAATVNIGTSQISHAFVCWRGRWIMHGNGVPCA